MSEQSKKQKSGNTTHRKRLARALAAQAGLTYAQALARVTSASEAGVLPSRLDDAGMSAALRVLTATGPVVDTRFSPAARLAGGPYTSKVLVGADLRQGMPRCDLCQRQIAVGEQWWLVVDPAQGWVHGHGAVCDVHGAEMLRVRDADDTGESLVSEEHVAGAMMLPLTDRGSRFPQVGDRHRTPYVGEGADGARRSAQIDREEIDLLPTGPHQPGWTPETEERRAALLASAEAWESQAAAQAVGHGDQATTAKHYLGPDDRPDAERLHLEKSSLALLRQVWQGRVAWQRLGVRKPSWRFTIDDQPASDIKDIELRWLRDHDYLTTPPLAEDDEWAVARTTDLGDEVLAFHGADQHRFYDGLPSRWMATRAEIETAANMDPKQAVQGRFSRNQIVQCGEETLKVSEFYDTSVTAQVVYPVPPRTTVRRWSYAEAATSWTEVSDEAYALYEKAWGFSG